MNFHITSFAFVLPFQSTPALRKGNGREFTFCWTSSERASLTCLRVAAPG
jgi:hypothetical protein